MEGRTALQLLCCALVAAAVASETTVTGSISFSRSLADRLDQQLDLSTVLVEATPERGTRLRTRCSADGTFSIALPDGSNSLRVASRGNLAFASNTAQVTCEAGACNDGQPLEFTVTGFILRGRVVDPDGNPVPGVDVFSGDIILGATNSQGKYKLSNVKPGRFDIQARKGRTVIAPLVGHQVHANDDRLPDMVVQLVTICGKIIYKNQTFDTFRRVSVSSDDGSFIDTVDVRFGKFCAQVGRPAAWACSPLPACLPASWLRTQRGPERPGSQLFRPGCRQSCSASPATPLQVRPGKYTVVPTTSKEERREGLVFRPASYNLAVRGDGLEDVDFVAEQTSLVGLMGQCVRVCVRGGMRGFGKGA
jgi:hypothetical protein